MNHRRRYWPFAVALIAVLVNLPLADVWWSDVRLDHDGQETTATVTGAHQIGDEEDRYFVVYELPEDADPEQREYNGQVDRAAYDVAQRTKRIDVEFLLDDPGTNRPVDRAPVGHVALYITIFADLALLGMVALMLWARRHSGLSLLATENVSRCKPDPVVQELGTGLYLVRGDVLEINEGEVVLVAAQGQRVRVVLGEFDNPVGHQQPAQVRGRKIPRR